MADQLTELLLEALSVTPPKNWPHKCGVCGRFVAHANLRTGQDHEGEYWATADCGNCHRRTNAHPI